jgi:hypothetical protein
MSTNAAAPALPQGYADPAAFDKYRQHLDPAAIDAALVATGCQSDRQRRLPMPQVVALVVAMALYRHLSIEQIALVLRLAKAHRGTLSVTSGAIAKARNRLGVRPLANLFRALAPREARAQAEAPAQRWRGLSLWGVDGSSVRAPDSPENRAAFGGHSGGERGDSAYPLVRLVVLMALRSHLLADVRFGRFARGELDLAKRLWAQLPDHSLTLVDRNFLSAAVLFAITRGGTQRHWLLRLKCNTHYRVVRALGPGDWLVELATSPEARRRDPTLPRTYQARVVAYQVRGFRAQKLLTSLVDARAYPAAELVLRYHERWELELGLDEWKTDLLGGLPILRSTSPNRVRQELWGALLAYHLVRREACAVATRAGVPPRRISFVGMRERLRDAWKGWVVAGGADWPPVLRELYETLEGMVLRPRRPDRCYPRAVKIKMSNYAKKRPAAAERTETRSVSKIAA